MKRKKLIAGAVIMALTLTTGVVAYAAANSQETAQSNGMSYQGEISMGGESALSFDEMDKDNLPDGVLYMDEISMSSKDALLFDELDKDDLPDGVSYMDEISIINEGAESLPLNK